MKTPERILHPWRATIVAATLTLGACDGGNDTPTGDDDEEVFYHLSLGNSLSVGVQPNSSGILLPTDDGYADQLYDMIRPGFEAGGNRKLELDRLGCPAETLDSMINGGSCLYFAGSQLDAAVDFLNDNGASVHLVTIDIGGNDFRNSGCIGATVDYDCVDAVSAQIATDLATVLSALTAAADPNTTIIGMNYYNPYLSEWLAGAAGQALAMDSAQAALVFSSILSTTYDTAGVPMADVYAAFESDDFVNIVPSMLPPPNDMLPVSVANICTFTYMCDTEVGPDIHATTAGYALIADTMAAILP